MVLPKKGFQRLEAKQAGNLKIFSPHVSATPNDVDDILLNEDVLYMPTLGKADLVLFRMALKFIIIIGLPKRGKYDTVQGTSFSYGTPLLYA